MKINQFISDRLKDIDELNVLAPVPLGLPSQKRLKDIDELNMLTPQTIYHNMERILTPNHVPSAKGLPLKDIGELNMMLVTGERFSPVLKDIDKLNVLTLSTLFAKKDVDKLNVLAPHVLRIDSQYILKEVDELNVWLPRCQSLAHAKVLNDVDKLNVIK